MLIPAWSLFVALVLGLLQVQSGDEALLKKSDVGAVAPASFRARLTLTSLPSKSRHDIEVWRAGDTRTLVRMLDQKERGKYLLRLTDQMWFLSNTAKKPVKLNAAYRLYGGATVDEILGVRLAQAYDIVSATREASDGGEVVVFALRAKDPSVLFPQVRYVVRESTGRPVSATYRLRSGKDATAVEFLEWSRGSVLYATRLVVKDLLHKGAVTEVDVTEVEPRTVPAELFSLEDGSARRALESGSR